MSGGIGTSKGTDRTAGRGGAAKAARIILVRHGVTDWNRAGRFQGQIDIPLNDEGRRQAELTGRRFGADREQGPVGHGPVAAVYSSDLSRALQTATPIAKALGIPLRREPALRERRYGSFEGHTRDDIIGRHDEAWRRWRSREPDFELPGGGESLRVFHERVERVLLELARRHPAAVIVAVTHGGVLDSAYRIASGLPLDAPRDHDLLNASLNHIAFDGHRFSLLGWADIAHLDEALDDVEARG